MDELETRMTALRISAPPSGLDELEVRGSSSIDARRDKGARVAATAAFGGW